VLRGEPFRAPDDPLDRFVRSKRDTALFGNGCLDGARPPFPICTSKDRLNGRPLDSLKTRMPSQGFGALAGKRGGNSNKEARLRVLYRHNSTTLPANWQRLCTLTEH
jgi:hypothetical protein